MRPLTEEDTIAQGEAMNLIESYRAGDEDLTVLYPELRQYGEQINDEYLNTIQELRPYTHAWYKLRTPEAEPHEKDICRHAARLIDGLYFGSV